MKKKNYCILLWILCTLLFGLPIQLKAQQSLLQSPNATIEKSLTAVKLEPLSFIVYQERNFFSYNTTVLYGLGTYYSFYKNTFPPLLGSRFIAERSNIFGRNYATSGITPYALVGLRKYITLDKRIRLNKNVQNKAGSYITLMLEYPLLDAVIEKDIDNLEIAVPVSILFGLRRSLSNRFFIEVGGGISYKQANTVKEIVPRLNASVSFQLR